MSDDGKHEAVGQSADTAAIKTALTAHVEAVAVAAAEAAHLAMGAGMVGDAVWDKAFAAAAAVEVPTVAGRAGAIKAFIKNAGERTIVAAAHAAAGAAGRRLDLDSIRNAVKVAARTVADPYIGRVIEIVNVPAGPPFEPSAAAASNHPIPLEREPMSEHTHQHPEVARPDDLWRDVLEKAAHEGDIDTDLVVSKYRAAGHERPVLSLIQDVNERIAIYGNLLEDVKRQSTNQSDSGRPTVAQKLKIKYEDLGLVPRGQLPNPLPAETAEYALKKIRRYSTLLLNIMAKYTKEVVRELKISIDVKVNLQVDMKLPWPGMTIGVASGGVESGGGA